jgi:hypothetical protein
LKHNVVLWYFFATPVITLTLQKKSHKNIILNSRHRAAATRQAIPCASTQPLCRVPAAVPNPPHTKTIIGALFALMSSLSLASLEYIALSKK